MNLPGFEDIPGLSKKVIAESTNCLRHLQVNTSEKAPVPSRLFQQAYRFRPSEVSALMAYLWMQGYPIGSNGKGYFWASLPGQLDQTIEHMESRLRRQYIIIQKVKEIREAMRDRLQQQEIEI